MERGGELKRYTALKPGKPLARGKPMKRTGIKKSARGKTKGAKWYRKQLDNMWAIRIKDRANWTCEKCGKKSDDGWAMNAHHKLHRDRMFFRHNTNNGVCLCSYCHTGSTSFSAHLTPEIFEKWLLGRPDEDWYAKNRYSVVTGQKMNWKQIYEMWKERDNGER